MTKGMHKTKDGKMAKKGFDILKGSDALTKPAMDLLKIAGEKYIGPDDNDTLEGTSALAKLLNVSDKMEAPLRDEVLKKFAAVLIRQLVSNPNIPIDDEQTFAEDALAKYLINIGSLSVAKPPKE